MRGKRHLSRAKKTGYDGSGYAIIEGERRSFRQIRVWGGDHASEGSRIRVRKYSSVKVPGNEGMEGSD